MTEDLTKQLPETDSEKLTLILTGVQALTGRVESVESLRPLLHQVVDDVSQLREGQVELRSDVSQIRTDISQLQEGQIELRKDVSQLREGQIELRKDVSQLREGQIELRKDVLQLHEGQRALSTEVRALRRDVDNRFGELYGKLTHMQIDHRDVHDRVTRLELNSTPTNTET